MKTNKEFSNQWDSLMIGNYSTPSIALSHGVGSYVWDVEGNKYLDLLGGIAVSVLGHSHAGITNAISNQATKLIHTSNLYMHEESLKLAQKLIVQFGAAARVFFCQDGATANEAALKLVRRYGYGIKPDGSKQVIVAMRNGFHGRTFGSLAITGNPTKRNAFGPFGFDVRFVEFNNFDSLRNAMEDDVAALFVEPIQGEGGMNFATSEFLVACQELCEKYQALFVLDEVQSGVGRTGTFFNFTQHNLRPDIVTLAKGLAGGLPIGAVVATESAATNFQAGDHGSTFGGNPVSTAAANVVVNTVTDIDFQKNVGDVSRWFVQQIQNLNLEQISGIRHAGHWYGIELSAETASEVLNKAQNSGFLINAVKANVIRLAPPLNIQKSELQTFIDVLPKLVS